MLVLTNGPRGRTSQDINRNSVCWFIWLVSFKNWKTQSAVRPGFITFPRCSSTKWQMSSKREAQRAQSHAKLAAQVSHVALCGSKPCTTQKHYHPLPRGVKRKLDGAARRLAQKVALCKPITEVFLCQVDIATCMLTPGPHYHCLRQVKTPKNFDAISESLQNSEEEHAGIADAHEAILESDEEDTVLEPVMPALELVQTDKREEESVGSLNNVPAQAEVDPDDDESIVSSSDESYDTRQPSDIASQGSDSEYSDAISIWSLESDLTADSKASCSTNSQTKEVPEHKSDVFIAPCVASDTTEEPTPAPVVDSYLTPVNDAKVFRGDFIPVGSRHAYISAKTSDLLLKSKIWLSSQGDDDVYNTPAFLTPLIKFWYNLLWEHNRTLPETERDAAFAGRNLVVEGATAQRLRWFLWNNRWRRHKKKIAIDVLHRGVYHHVIERDIYVNLADTIVQKLPSTMMSNLGDGDVCTWNAARVLSEINKVDPLYLSVQNSETTLWTCAWILNYLTYRTELLRFALPAKGVMGKSMYMTKFSAYEGVNFR